MGIDYSYTCTKATAKEQLGTYDGQIALLCDLEFEDEHGHAFAPIQGAVVVLGDNDADIEQYALNILPEDTDDPNLRVGGTTFERFQKLCEDGWPGYHVYNTEELATMLRPGVARNTTGENE